MLVDGHKVGTCHNIKRKQPKLLSLEGGGAVTLSVCVWVAGRYPDDEQNHPHLFAGANSLVRRAAARSYYGPIL